MDTIMLARRIAAVIERNRIDISTEDAAHRAIRAALERDGIEAQSEVRLSPKERIDLMAGSVGIEVKVGHSRRAILAQLERYAALPEIAALVLATGTAGHAA